MKAFLVFLAVTIGGSLHAQQVEIKDFEVILVPSLTLPREGAHGSVWATTFTVRNDATEAVIFSRGDPECKLGSCPSPYIQISPLTTEVRTGGAVPDIPYVGALFYVERRHATSITMNLRLRELSRNESNLGTNVPVIRETELRTGKIQLLNVPVDPLHRINVRIFEVDRAGSPEVIVRALAADDVLWSERIALAVVPTPSPFSQYPAEAVLYSVEERVPPSACCDPIRIEIEPVRPGRYWAYATVVDNATQDVLLVTPE